MQSWSLVELKDAINHVGITDYSIVCGYRCKADPDADTSLDGQDIRLAKSSLTGDRLELLNFSLRWTPVVGAFIEMNSMFDLNLGWGMCQEFVQTYRSLISEGFRGDALFDRLQEYCAHGFRDLRRTAAASLVLAYLLKVTGAIEAEAAAE